MEHAIRSFALAGLIATSLSALAQPAPPYPISIVGTLEDCLWYSQITVTTLPGTQPSGSYVFDLVNCSFDTLLYMDLPGGGFTFTTSCNGETVSAVGQYQINFLGNDSIFVGLSCGGVTEDCLGVPGGTAVTGTPCTTVLNEPGVFGPDCTCVPFASACNACFTVSQDSIGGAVTPFEATFFSCSSSVGGEYTLSWNMPDGSGPIGENTTYTFPGPSTYVVCLTMTGINNNCTSTFCDSVYVDEFGNVSMDGSMNFDCLMIANGPNLPGTPCTDPATGEAGLWSADCVCLPDSSSTDCQAGFWVVQAYTYTDTINNPGGGVEPIPNEVWVWNLSSGGDGNYQFFWSFGDGSSSTEAYPTHVYATGGPYQLCLTMTDGSGCTSTYCDDVSVDEDGLYTGLIVDGRPGLLRSGFTIRVRSEQPTAIAERELLENVALWPNPVEDVIGLSFNSLNNASLSLTIFDLNGRVVRSTNTVVNSGQNDHRIHVADLEAGLYLLQITNGEQRTSRRFVKR